MKKLSTSILLTLGIVFAASVSVGSQAWFPDGLQSKGSVTIGEKATADSKAVLDVRSTTKGFLPPRMTTTQRDAIASPPAGLTVYNTTTNKLNQFNGTAWGEVAGSGSSGAQYNVLTNYNFEDTTYSTGWTASGGTLAAAAGTNIIFNSQSATWDSSSASQTLSYDAITVGQGYKGNNCEGAIYVQTPSGTATHLLQVFDGTYVLASTTVTTSTTPKEVSTGAFPCPTSGTIQLRLLSVASNEPLIAVDNAYLGLARNLGVTQINTAPVSYTPTIGVTGGTTTASAKWQRIGPDIEVWGDVTFTTVFTGGTMTVGLPSVCTIDTARMPVTPATGVGIIDSRVYLYDVGSGQYPGTVTYNDTSSVLIRTLQDDVGASADYLMADRNVTTLLPFTWANGDRMSFRFKVPCVGWDAQTVVMPDAQGWYVDASISGANVGLGTTSVSSYSVIGSSTLSMTKASGSADVQVPCSGGNAPSGLTCSAGSELFGAAFNIPKSGAYRVCLAANHYIDSPAGSINVVSTFQLAETSTTSDTIIQEGKGKAMSGSVSISGDRREYRSVYVCGDFVFSSVGQKVVKLMYETEISGTPDNHYIKADGDSVLGQPDVHITVYPLQGKQEALLANSVSTSAQNGLKTESFSFSCSGTSSIGVQLGGTSWVSSIGNISAGVCAVAIAAGTFSGSPQCQATWTGGGSNSMIYTYAETSTGFNVGAVTDTGVAASSFTGKAMCVGPR